MDDFTKTKTAFAAGLLALLFTAWPLLEALLGQGFAAFGISITIRGIYFVVTGALSVSVYATGLRLLTQAPWRRTEWVANVTYALALVVPPAALLLFLVVRFAELLADIVQVPVLLSWLSHLSTALVGVASAVSWVKLSQVFRKRSSESAVGQLARVEETQFTRAEDLYRQGHYDLAAIDAHKSLESAAQKRLLALGKLHFGPRVESPVRRAEQVGLIQSDLLPALKRVQLLRNRAAHAGEPLRAEEAREVLTLTGRLLAALTEPDGEDEASPSA